MRLLLEGGANKNPLEKDRWLSVHLASSMETTEVVYLILEAARMRSPSSKLEGVTLISPSDIFGEFTDRTDAARGRRECNYGLWQDVNGWTPSQLATSIGKT